MSLAFSAALAARLERVRDVLAGADLQALIVSHLPNIFYLTNFSASAGLLLVARDAVHVVTDFRYLSAVSVLQTGPSACPGLQICPVQQSYEETLVARLTELGLRRVGFEAAHLTVSRLRWIEATLRHGLPM